MNFGLNKVTGTSRQTVEQLKHKVIDGGGGGGGSGSWEEILASDLDSHYDDNGMLWYQIPQDADNILIEFTNGSDITGFGVQEAEIPDSENDWMSVRGEEESYWLHAGTCEIEKKVALYNMQISTQITAADGGYNARSIVYSFSSKSIWVCYFDLGEGTYIENTHIKIYKKV